MGHKGAKILPIYWLGVKEQIDYFPLMWYFLRKVRMYGTFTGKLLFVGQGYGDPLKDQPLPYPWAWNLVQPGELPKLIFPEMIWNLLHVLNGQEVVWAEDFDSFSIRRGVGWGTLWIDGRCAPITSSATGASAVNVRITDALMRLTGREVRAEITPEGVLVEADRTKSVFGVRYDTGSNHCLVSNTDAEAICGVRTSDNRCIFSREMGDGSFHCDKFSTEAYRYLDAHAKKRMKPQFTRIGDCALLRSAEKPNSTAP